MVVFDFIETKESKSETYNGTLKGLSVNASSATVSSNTINATDLTFIEVTASGNLQTISGGVTGQLLTIIANGSLTVEDVADNITLSGSSPTNFSMADRNTLQLVYDGTMWNEVSRSVNTAP